MQLDCLFYVVKFQCKPLCTLASTFEVNDYIMVGLPLCNAGTCSFCIFTKLPCLHCILCISMLLTQVKHDHFLYYNSWYELAVHEKLSVHCYKHLMYSTQVTSLAITGTDFTRVYVVWSIKSCNNWLGYSLAAGSSEWTLAVASIYYYSVPHYHYCEYCQCSMPP